jgi:hypothetical protein
MAFKKFFTLVILVLLSCTSFAQSIENTVESNEGVKKPKKKKYDKLVYLAPIQFTENGFGFGFGFEQVIDKDGIVAYTLPFIGTFNLAKDDYYGNHNTDPMYYFMPGLKFYPTGCKGKVKYALGPSVVAGFGKTSNYNDYYYIRQQRDKFVLGVMINNSMNINVTKSIYMGMELGFGFTYINQSNGVRQGMSGLVQGGFKMGYKF